MPISSTRCASSARWQAEDAIKSTIETNRASHGTHLFGASGPRLGFVVTNRSLNVSDLERIGAVMGPFQVRSGKISVLEFGLREICSLKICTLEVRSPEIGFQEIGQ